MKRQHNLLQKLHNDLRVKLRMVMGDDYVDEHFKIEMSTMPDLTPVIKYVYDPRAAGASGSRIEMDDMSDLVSALASVSTKRKEWLDDLKDAVVELLNAETNGAKQEGKASQAKAKKTPVGPCVVVQEAGGEEAMARDDDVRCPFLARFWSVVAGADDSPRYTCKVDDAAVSFDDKESAAMWAVGAPHRRQVQSHFIGKLMCATRELSKQRELATGRAAEPCLPAGWSMPSNVRADVTVDKTYKRVFVRYAFPDPNPDVDIPGAMTLAQAAEYIVEEANKHVILKRYAQFAKAVRKLQLQLAAQVRIKQMLLDEALQLNHLPLHIKRHLMRPFVTHARPDGEVDMVVRTLRPPPYTVRMAPVLSLEAGEQVQPGEGTGPNLVITGPEFMDGEEEASDTEEEPWTDDEVEEVRLPLAIGAPDAPLMLPAP